MFLKAGTLLGESLISEHAGIVHLSMGKIN